MSSSQNDIQENFDIRPAATKKWISNLPMGSTGETSKQLYHALKKVNKQSNPPEQHLEFLETIAPTLTLLYPRLAKYFTNIALPLGKQSRNAIHVTNSLLKEFLLGYQTVIKTQITNKPFGWKKSCSLALHRCLIFSSHILCTQRLSYQPYTKGLWHEIFWCYQQAEKLKLINKSFRNFNENEDKTSIDFEFKKLLLLSLLSTNNLGLKNMQEVHNLMPLWVEHTNILLQETDDKKNCFTLNLLSDIPPYLAGTRKDNPGKILDKRFLSTSKLNNLLNKYLSRIEDKDGAIKIGRNILSKSTIQSLLNSWSRIHLRSDVRKEGTGFVDIVTGITAIHFVLNQQDQPAFDEGTTTLPDNVIDFESTIKIEPISPTIKHGTLNLNHFLSISDHEEDIWNKVYENSINETLPLANWTESGIHKVYNFSKSILLDYSKDGYRLSVNANTVDSLKHNELVAVREHALAPWALAQVKWLHFSEMGDVQFGLKILSHHVLPINIRYEANHGLSKPLPCLLGLDRKKLMIFIPSLPTNLNGKKLELEHQKQHSQIYLKNKVLTTTAFDVYEIHESQNNDSNSLHHQDTSEIIIENNDNTQLSDNIWQNF